MTTVNINITSSVGFRNSFDAINGPPTYLQTIRDLEGNVYSPTLTPTKTLEVSELDDFIVYLTRASNTQTVYLTNSGNSVLTITSVQFTSKEVTPIYTFGAGWVNSSTTIASGSTATFQLRYAGSKQGNFINSFVIKSNNDFGNFKITTNQKVGTLFDYTIEPANMTNTLARWGQQTVSTFAITPLIDSVTLLDASLTGSSGYRLGTVNTGSVELLFDCNEVGNVDGTYTSVLSVTANGITKTINNSVRVLIDDVQFRHIASWISPASYDNSIVGMSYDIIGGVKTLTIGVGAGGNDTPEYTAGGSIFISTSTLGLASAEIIEVYPYWREVYKIELDGTENRYQANTSTRVKLSGDVAYASYFGEYESHGTICIVDDDSFGNLTVRMNHLRETAGTESLDRTLDNLTRSFYYYSSSDIPSRYANTQPGPILDGTVTEQFTGFYNNGQVVTSIVSLPN
jgi:hypothetical protein